MRCFRVAWNPGVFVSVEPACCDRMDSHAAAFDGRGGVMWACGNPVDRRGRFRVDRLYMGTITALVPRLLMEDPCPLRLLKTLTVAHMGPDLFAIALCLGFRKHDIV